MNLDLIKDNAVVICPHEAKIQILKEISLMNPTLHIKFLTKERLFNDVNYSFSIEAIKEVHDKYGYSYDMSDEILKNGFGVSKYNNKLNNICEILEYLKEKNLLEFNGNFAEIFKNKNIYILGYSKFDRELVDSLNKMGIINYEYLEFDNQNFNHSIYMFDSIEEEIESCFMDIAEKITSGVSLNNIYFYNLPSEYNNIVKKYMFYLGIPCELFEKEKLYNTTIYKKYVALLQDMKPIDAFNELTNNNYSDAEYKALCSAIVELNDLTVSKDVYLDLLNHVAKSKTIEREKFKSSIKKCNYNYIPSEDDYIYVLGFSAGIYPRVHMDNEFLSDDERNFIGKNNSDIRNAIEEDLLTKFINKTKNIWISFKCKDSRNKYYKSKLVEKLNLKEELKLSSNERYSMSLAKLEVSSYLDTLRKYAIDNKYSKTFSPQELNYNVFDFNFKGFEDYKNDDKLELSYSQIDLYYRCPFEFYLSRILKVDEFEKNFHTQFGTIFHDILEDSLTKTINLSDYDEVIDNTFSTAKDRFFCRKLLKQLINVIKLNDSHLNNTCYSNLVGEHTGNWNIDDNTTINGRIDKIMFDEDGKKYVVIDYKTGDTLFTKDEIEEGHSLQLPIYINMLKEEYPDYLPSGLFIQPVCKDREDEDNYKLNGLIVDDPRSILRLDTSVAEGEKSKYFANIALTTQGNISKNNSILSDEKFNEIIELSKAKVNEAIKKIRSGNYRINPSHLDKKEYYCKYCNMQSVCFRRLNKIKDDGGEDDEL